MIVLVPFQIVFPIAFKSDFVKFETIMKNYIINISKNICWRKSSPSCRRTSKIGCWPSRYGLVDEAIHHALSAGEPVRAAKIVEQYRHIEHEKGRWHVVEKWMIGLPKEIKEKSPALLLAEAWIAFVRFQIERIPPILQRVEPLLPMEVAALRSGSHPRETAGQCRSRGSRTRLPQLRRPFRRELR